MSDFGDYPRITSWGCPGDHGCLLLDLGPGAVDLVCEDPNCTYDPLAPAVDVTETDPVSPLDAINPPHYRWLPSGVEVIDVTEWLPFNVGNVIKYCLRSDHKNSAIEDLKKARWYLDREIARREKMEEMKDGPAS